MKIMKRLAIIVFLILLTGSAACAPERISGTQMAQANQLYEAGQFGEAAAVYQSLVDSGADDGTLYYNLGNAYYKSGDLGRAILNYRRAQLILPRDSDVETNLQLARDQTIDQLKSDSDSVIDSMRHILIEWTTLNEAAGIMLGIWLLLCALVITTILWPRGRQVLRYAIAIVAVIVLISVISFGIRISDSHDDSAVVTSQSVEARSGPGDDYLTEFTLHAGAEVRTVEHRDNWVRIALPGNLQGWLPSESVENL